MEEQVNFRWRKSRHSDGGNGQCVEAGNAFGEILVRDFKLADASPVLRFSASIWREFISVVKAE
jgi:hypothetical protein